MDMRKIVGQNFERLRREKGFTQEQFAARSGFSQQYLSGLENGKRNPTVVTLYELADVLGVECVELLKKPVTKKKAPT
jgi:transcriptional regulator with XRE-family HTH domain